MKPPARQTDRYAARLDRLHQEAATRGLADDSTVAELERLASDLLDLARRLEFAAETAAGRVDEAWVDTIDARTRLLRATSFVQSAVTVLDLVEPDVPIIGDPRRALEATVADGRAWLASRQARHQPDYLGPLVSLGANRQSLAIGRPLDARRGDRVAIFVSATRQETP